MGLLKEFKDFAVRGNVIDLAVAVIIGAAFSRIIDSIIKDLIMPIIAAAIGTPDFSQAYISFKDVPAGTTLAKAKEMGPVFAYGNFITEVVNFLLLALIVFLIVRSINSMRRKEPPPATTKDEVSSTDKLLVEIRDLLKSGNNPRI